MNLNNGTRIPSSTLDFDHQVLKVGSADSRDATRLSESRGAHASELLPRLGGQGPHLDIRQLYGQLEIAELLDALRLGPLPIEVAGLLQLQLGGQRGIAVSHFDAGRSEKSCQRHSGPLCDLGDTRRVRQG